MEEEQKAPVEPPKPEEQPVEQAEKQPTVAEIAEAKKLSKFQQFKQFYLKKKKITIPATVLAVLLIILAIPWSRYQVLGLFIKQSVTVNVTDSTTKTPVSGAKVSFNGVLITTNGAGKATANINLGNHTLSVTKQYYKTNQSSQLVSLSKSKNIYTVSLVASGRQVPVTVTNKIDGSPAAGVKIQVLDTEATTDKNGKATLVLPTSAATQKAKLQGSGYNSTTVNIKVTGNVDPANTFAVTPSGSLYFLSNASGKLDVVKTDLDGANRQTVLAGTGKEDIAGTALLATRDWKYLALLSKRDGGDNAKLFLINTANDKLSTIDEGNGSFTLTGWSGHSFVYIVNRSDVPVGQPKQQALKSYNADTNSLNTLDETTAESNGSSWIREEFGDVYIINSQAIYAKNWYANYGIPNFSKQATLNSVSVNGGNKQTIKSFGYPANTQAYNIYITTRLYAPKEIDIAFNDLQNTTFYEYSNGQVATAPTMTSDKFYNTPYPTYLESPSSKQTFWGEPRDGKNALFLGDDDGNNKKQIAAGSENTAYGWYSDSYLLTSKNSSELYIMGTTPNSKPLKVTDYYKPALNFNGYGGGYGGL